MYVQYYHIKKSLLPFTSCIHLQYLASWLSTRETGYDLGYYNNVRKESLSAIEAELLYQSRVAESNQPHPEWFHSAMQSYVQGLIGPFVLAVLYICNGSLSCPKPRLHGNSDPDPDPNWLRLHGDKLDSNPDSDHLSHVDCDPDSNPDSGPGAHVNATIDMTLCTCKNDLCCTCSRCINF